MQTPKLETKRLLLRTFTKEDTEKVFNCWMQDNDVAKYMMWEASDDIENAKGFIDFELGQVDNDKWFRWCIEDKGTNEIIGTCLVYFNEEEDYWDISYNLGKKFWGEGYTTEAMKAAINFAINTVGVKEFTACHAVENPASGKVMEKLGFHYECDVKYICNGGKIHTTGKKYCLRVE